MKLTSRSELVKPDRTVLVSAGLAALLTVTLVQIVLVVTDREQQRMDRFGTAAAGTLAALVVEPLMRQDRMHLGVIGNRLAALPEISGVASFSTDDQVLASTGVMSGPQYQAPVTIDGTVVGYVRVAIHPPAFAASAGTRLAALLLTALLVPWTLASAWTLARAIRRGELAIAWPHRPRWLQPPAPASAAQRAAPEEDELREPVADRRHYLLAVNLYNQLTLAPAEREFEQSLCRELAGAVAGVYHGEVEALPGVGTLVDFDHSDDDDRTLQVICAAFVLMRLLRQEAPFGHYRLGLNLATRPADESIALDDGAIADAALLSALARDGTLTLSLPFRQALPEEERVLVQPLTNPLLDELVTSGPGCFLVTGLQTPFAELVARQADQLKAARDEISSPSTF